MAEEAVYAGFPGDEKHPYEEEYGVDLRLIIEQKVRIGW
jgi:hypothetical protein